MKKYLFCCMASLVGAITLTAQAPKLTFTHLSNDQGLSNSTIEAIFQDSQGFIWFATRDGLNRYDGAEIITYRNNPADTTSLSDSYIRCICEDQQHNLWVGTINGLNRLNRAKNNFTRFRLSSNAVSSIAEDKKGNLWIGTDGGGVNLLNNNRDSFIYFRHNPSTANSLADDRVNHIYVDKKGNCWVGTEAGLDLFNATTGTFTSYLHSAAAGLSGNAITVIGEDRQGNLWLGTKNDGLYLFDPLQKTFTSFAHSDKDPGSLGNNMVRTLLVDKKGQLWCGTINGGLNLYNPSARSFSHYENEPGNAVSLSQRTISALFEDNQGNLWIGTHRGGVNIYSPGKEKFDLYRQESSPNSLSYSDVKAFCEDDGGNIWVGTDGGGLDLFLRDKHIFQHYRYDPFNNNSIGSDAILNVMRDRGGNLWVSTWGGGLNLLDKTTRRFTRFQHRAGDSSSISSDFVQQTFEDYEGKIWVATYYGGLNLFDPKKRRFTRLIDDPSGQTSLTGKNIVAINDDKEGNIWIGTDDGGLNCYHPSTRHFSHYFNKGERMPDLRVIFCDSRGRVWIGQKGLYLLDVATDSFRIYTDKAGLSDDFIKGITEDGQGNLWIAGSDGLVQFNPETRYSKKYNTGDGLQGVEFETNACLKTKDGEMYFGGINGFNSFYPANIKANQFIPPVYITSFQLSNKKIYAGPLTRDITLSYRQSTFSFNFVALNYIAPENNEYAYKLEGLDTSWNYVGKEKKASYTNLGPGDYVFRVRASNNDGVWNEEGAAIKITITPPFWKTNWFLALLSIIIAACLYAFYRFRTRLRLNQLEAAKREEIRQVQLQFFTNISHEFRTPLSLILGPLEKIMKENPHSTFRHYYSIMHRNTQRLLSLINELMDFGKLESGTLHLNVMKGNLNTFLDEIAEEFRDWAVRKEIDFTILDTVILPDTWFDRQVLEKIVLNLLHNSFKYTRAGGHITLEYLSSMAEFQPAFANELILRNEFRGSAYAYIRVVDNGIGISKESIQHLFERYYRTTDSHLGSGVGLAFVKSLTLLHKGDIYVYSDRLKGTEIIVGIPINESDYRQEEKSTVLPTGGVRLEGFDSIPDDAPLLPPTQSASTIPPDAILLVEDNDELREFLKESLHESYHVVEARNGKEGLDMAKANSPSLIITDVIMPGMNGFDFCRAVKQDIDTSHIPVVILTARTTTSSQVEGLDAGADYYFSKPLNMDLLLLTIRNRFDQDRKLKQRYSNDSHVQAMDLVHSEKDKEFMTRLLQIIDTQLANPDFEIGYLCQEMGMSRTRLYQKIKSISHQPIGDFIRTVRLKTAVQIMTHEDVSLSEVMVRVGIQTQSYFTKAFKKEFGKTPTQFIQEMKKF